MSARGPEKQPGRDAARLVARGHLRVAVVSNVVGAVVLFVALAFVGDPTSVFDGERHREVLFLFVGLLAVGVAPFLLLVTRRLAPVVRAFTEGGPVVGTTRRTLLLTPWVNAIATLVAWACAATVFSVHAVLRLEQDRPGAAVLGLTILLGGLSTTAVVYLLTERVLQPAYAVAFSDEPPTEVTGVAMGPRLLWSWVVGAGAPFAALALLLLDPDNPQLGFSVVRNVALALIATGGAAGAVITARLARSVAGSLGSLRGGLARVESGDLTAKVPVDDATEVGLLQVGFNAMVDGLRERERIRDLFGRHVGREVVLRALDTGAELGGEEREVSAVFIDIVGSTPLTASRSPSATVELLNDFFRLVVEATEIEGGLVNKFQGDAALCVFGAPARQPEHAAAALRTAVRLRLALDALRDRHPELDAGIGVSSGTVVAGNVGSEDRYEYTVIGDAVNEAARLSDEAKRAPSRVLAAGPAVAAAGDASSGWVSVGERRLRGLPTPTVCYEPASATRPVVGGSGSSDADSSSADTAANPAETAEPSTSSHRRG